MTLTMFPYDYGYFKNPTKEFLDFLTFLAKEMFYDMDDLSWNHNDSDECRYRWDAGGNWTYKKILGKIINQNYEYDYIGKKCPGLIEVSSEWDDGLDLKSFKNKSLLEFKFDKKTHKITYNKFNPIQ